MRPSSFGAKFCETACETSPREAVRVWRGLPWDDAIKLAEMAAAKHPSSTIRGDIEAIVMGDTVAGSIKDDNANRAQQSFAVCSSPSCICTPQCSMRHEREAVTPAAEVETLHTGRGVI